jgi:hypothetical protein
MKLQNEKLDSLVHQAHGILIALQGACEQLGGDVFLDGVYELQRKFCEELQECSNEVSGGDNA